MPSSDQAILNALAAHPPRPDSLLPILHAIQDALGWVPPAATARIAAALNLSAAEVHGVISFYHHFRTAPPGAHVLQLCRAEACQAMGGAALEAHARARLGIDYQQTSADGGITLEAVYCLGNCACAPSLRLDNQLVGRVDRERLDALLAELGQERSA